MHNNQVEYHLCPVTLRWNQGMKRAGSALCGYGFALEAQWWWKPAQSGNQNRGYHAASAKRRKASVIEHAGDWWIALEAQKNKTKRNGFALVAQRWERSAQKKKQGSRWQREMLRKPSQNKKTKQRARNKITLENDVLRWKCNRRKTRRNKK